MKKLLLLISLEFLILLPVSATNYFVAPDGNDTTGTGTIDAPYATIMKANENVVAGDTVYLRGGVYKMTEAQINRYYSIWAYMNYMDKSGTSTKRICYWAYRDEKPIIDMSAVKPVGYRIIVFYVKGSYLHFKGLQIIGTQVTITTHTQSECFRNEGGNYNIYEQCSMHDGMAIGFYLTKGMYNLVLNCDAYNNWDNVSENQKGGNVDGFGGHPNSTGSVGNVFRGCRAWFNSDDGYDCINAYASITFDHCWAFYNGYSTSFESLGDGNGFKAGGYGQAPVVSRLPSPIPSHTVEFCMAYGNKANGIYANHHVQTGDHFYNNTSYHNGINYNMLSQEITISSKTDNDTTIDCSGFNHVLHNNLSFRYSTQTEVANMGTCVNTYNSFSPNSGVNVTADDFVSVDASSLTAPRQADGSLPDINFLKLKEGSDLIDKGMSLGFPFNGTAPDLGAFESDYSTSAVPLIISDNPLFFPNPVRDILNFSSKMKQVQIYCMTGELILTAENINQMNVSNLKKGIYIMQYIQSKAKQGTVKFVKA